ncbi:hypothetical protein Tco_0988040 [Tanacetum coccineum]|uniref:Uncharacterized protein n=1 Tax=Tanacetum coccineum TaxID=301880 RepID=A0ABQ5EPU8_9ASTR
MPSLALTIHSYLPPLPPRLMRKGLCMISTKTGNELQHNEAQSESNGHSTNETNDANLSQMRNQNELGGTLSQSVLVLLETGSVKWISPDIISYNIVLIGLCSCRKIPDVVQYLSDAGRHFVKLQLGLAFFFMQTWCKKGVYDDLQLALSVVVITLSKVSFSLHYSSKACIWLSIFPHYLSKNRIEENPSQRWSKEFLRSARCLVAFILNLNFYDFFVGLQMLGVSRGQEFSQCLLPLMKIQ